ncbi:MAG: Smr/MutS family protein [bacterium]|nr:Smr/MutS family protein [bacterium]
MNKYERIPDYIIDLHGYTTREAKDELDKLFKNNYKHVRVITGKGTFRETGPVLRTFVKKYLVQKGYRYNPAKIADGGDGALEVFTQ